jgi:hypothetical protein
MADSSLIGVFKIYFYHSGKRGKRLRMRAYIFKGHKISFLCFIDHRIKIASQFEGRWFLNNQELE